MRYPNGKIYKQTQTNKANSKQTKLINAANRGMSLEEDINESNLFYYSNDICLVQKRQTPINVVKVDYSHGCKIIDAYFEKQSTTDYNGLYMGKYIDFEAKNTMNKTSFPLANICKHQIEHLKKVLLHNGIAFFIIKFQQYNEVYLLDAKYIIDFYEHGERKSIPYSTIKENGTIIKQGFLPRLNYIEAIDKNYFRR